MTDYSKMSDIEINNLVFDAIQEAPPSLLWGKSRRYLDFCNNPAEAWPIIAISRIGLVPNSSNGWYAMSIEEDFVSDESNPLRAAMIVFLMMKEAGNV